MTGVRMHAPWIPLDEANVEAVGAHMGVYELGTDGEVGLIGFAGGRSLFGLRGELRRALRQPQWSGASFRYEVTTAYLSRYKELLMVHVADHGSLPASNTADGDGLGRMSPLERRDEREARAE
jgi:hypothetical protein